MHEIQIKTETEEKNRWVYDVGVSQNGKAFSFRVTLSWQDYDLWCHGRLAPQRVVRAAFEFLLSREPASAILAKFDCSVMRRYFPDVDAELPKFLSAG